MASDLTEGQTIGIMVGGVSLLGIIAAGAYKYNSVVEEKRQEERIQAQEANTKTQAERRKISDDRAKKEQANAKEAATQAAVNKQMRNQKIERLKSIQNALLAAKKKAAKEKAAREEAAREEAARKEPIKASGRWADLLGLSSITGSIVGLLNNTHKVPIIGSLNTGNGVVNKGAVEIIRTGEFIKSPPFIIGTSDKTYTGYRKVTCADWNNIAFRQYFVDFYKDNKGIENKMTKIPKSTMLVFGRSYPRVNHCQIEVVNVESRPKCQLSYCNAEIYGLKYFDFDKITPELLRDSTCSNPEEINGFMYSRIKSINHDQPLFPETILPCLFVHDNVTVGARRSIRKRTQKKR